jgi:hypothetical protein
MEIARAVGRIKSIRNFSQQADLAGMRGTSAWAARPVADGCKKKSPALRRA